MASNEDIEARLCAYIEGDLDAAQREEIERHLAAHPQHQTMIADLVATKQMLTSLPTAEAPADLCDGLQGQLERSMLLGDDPREHDQWRAHVRRFPRFAVLSGVTLAAAGLGIAILQLLRAGSHPHIAPIGVPPVVVMAPATQPTTQPVFEAVAPATQPTVQLAAFSLPPATQPSPDDITRPDGDDIETAPVDWPVDADTPAQ